jgi:hypothetical protein
MAAFALFLVFDFHHSFAFICAAFWADMMGDVIFSTTFANHQMIERQAVVSTTITATAAGKLSLWQRTHRIAPLI